MRTDGDYEYMVWQEWKEGFARFIENRIRRKLDLSENHDGREEPFDRVVFYEGGAGFLELLGIQDPRMTIEIDRFFETMFLGLPEAPTVGWTLTSPVS